MESKDFESGLHLNILSRDVVFDKIYMLNSKSDEDLGKAEDVTKQMEFKSSTIKKH